MAKFSKLDDNQPFDYGQRFFRQPCGDGERLVIGPTDNHVALLEDLSASWNAEQFYLLYVLIVSHTEAPPGRYASPLIESRIDLCDFVEKYREFFESDGRHHIWLAKANSPDLLVYDHHNVIFAYGDIAQYESTLTERGFSRDEFWFPMPHSHSYPTENIAEQERILAHWSWHMSELQPGDEWE